MNVKLGKKIRELRKTKNISQEVLAQYLGISFQAVSKWENDTAMPDVALIPVLASFFGVSTDELFDYNRLEVEQKIENICTEAAKFRESDPAKSEAMLREGLKQFPGNDVILNNLLYTLKSPEQSEEIITICKTLVEATAEDDVRYDALRILATAYHEMGQQALVEPTLEQIPEIYFTKLEQMAMLLEGDKALKAARSHMGLCAEQMVNMLLILRDGYKEKGQNKEVVKYEAIAKGILLSFKNEEEENFLSKEFYDWINETLKDL